MKNDNLHTKAIALRLAVAACAALAAVIIVSAQDSAGHKIKALILTGANNHDWKSTTPLLKRIYEESGRFTVDVTEDPPSALKASNLAKYDVLVGNWAAWPKVTGHQWGAEGEKAFADYIKKGGGFALFHAASATFQDWPEYQQIAGGTWDTNKTGHGAIHEFEVKVVDAGHPVTRGLAGFKISDELWHRTGFQTNVHVLCEAFSAKEKGGSGQMEPVAITTSFGMGRGFYNVLGHDTNAMNNPGWQALMLRGTEWAATGKEIAK